MKHIALLILLCINICLNAHGRIDPFREEANRILPFTGTYYGYRSIWDALSPHLAHPDDFEYPLKIMFNQLPEQVSDSLRFSPPPHSPAMVTGGWQCLLGKVLRAEFEENAEKLQKEALLTLLGLHKSQLVRIADPKTGLGDMAHKLLDDVLSAVLCPTCLASARAMYAGDR